jgi:hypothetical protein
MENPEVEIERVVQLLVRAASPDIQQAAVRKCVVFKMPAPKSVHLVETPVPSDISLAMPAFATRCIA